MIDRAFAVSAACDLLLAVGSTLSVYPAASCVPIAARAGAKVVIVNGSPTEMDLVADAVLRGQISEILPAWWRGASRHDRRVLPSPLPRRACLTSGRPPSWPGRYEV